MILSYNPIFFYCLHRYPAFLDDLLLSKLPHGALAGQNIQSKKGLFVFKISAKLVLKLDF